MVCQRAVTLIVDICLHNSTLLDQDTCQEFLIVLTSQDSGHKQLGKSCNYSHVCGLPNVQGPFPKQENVPLVSRHLCSSVALLFLGFMSMNPPFNEFSDPLL